MAFPHVLPRTPKHLPDLPPRSPLLLALFAAFLLSPTSSFGEFAPTPTAGPAADGLQTRAEVSQGCFLPPPRSQFKSSGNQRCFWVPKNALPSPSPLLRSCARRLRNTNLFPMNWVRERIWGKYPSWKANDSHYFGCFQTLLRSIQSCSLQSSDPRLEIYRLLDAALSCYVSSRGYFTMISCLHLLTSSADGVY